MNLLGAVKFPPIENVIEWPAWLFEDSTYFAFNKIAFIHFLGLVIPMAVFLLGARGSGLVPRGFRTVSEGIVTFVDEQIAKPGIGHGREPYLPLLVSFFLFIFIGNITEVIPFFQMPANARMAGPLVLALVAWGMFISVGVRHNGPGYFKEVLFPPGVPKALYLLGAALQSCRPSLRQHARRPHPAHHLRRAVHLGLVGVGAGPHPDRHLPRPRGLHRLRGRCVADPGVRLHDPRCRVHRRRSPPGALIARSSTPVPTKIPPVMAGRNPKTGAHPQ